MARTATGYCEKGEGQSLLDGPLIQDMSAQLSDSCLLLEDKVASLTEELNHLSAKRCDELAEKERLAQRLESLLHVLPGGVIVIDAKGYITECNPAAIEMLGEPLKGLLWRDVITRSFAPRDDDGHEVSTKDGRRFSIATRSLPLEGQIILLTDQTETRRLQAALSRHDRLSALGRMVSALAHQIRTPLSAAMLYAGHLCNDQINESQRLAFAEKLLKRLNHMERQVQDMLLFVKGELPLNDEISLQELHRDLVDAVEMPVSTSGATCQWIYPEHGSLLIRCHRDALIGAVLNLVNNAIQASEGKPQLTIELALSEQKDQLTLTVTDRGRGIAPELIDSVLDAFVTTRSQGTGLGLAIVQSVARAHGGRVELTSTLHKGTRVMLQIPLNMARQSQAVSLQSSPLQSGPLQAAALQPVASCS